MIGNDLKSAHYRGVEGEFARERRLTGVIVAYGDDSSDRQKQTVFAVGILLGSGEQWANFKTAWVDRNGRVPFHATDCESGWGDYRGVDREVRNRLYRDLVTMLANSELFGFATAVKIKDYVAYRGESSTPEMAYYTCFLDAVVKCAGFGALSIPPQKIDLTFDRNFDRDPNTSDLYAYFGALQEWEHREYLGDRICFANYREEAGVQAADLLARETMKHMENTMLGPRERWARGSFIRLGQNPRFHFRFMDRTDMMWSDAKYPPRLDANFEDDYKKWREEMGLQGDTLIYRLRFMRLQRSIKKRAELDADNFDNEL